MDPILERYRPLVNDFAAFADACARPLPTCIWTNPLRVDWEEVRDELAAEGLDAEPVAWSREAWRLHSPMRLVDSLGYRAGVFHVQEEASQLPVALLGIDPSCRVLDLCAAPGGKTALIAIRLGGRGTVIANDPSRGRQSVTRTTLDRLGLANVSLTDRDGRDPSWPEASFDRVLVDAPCTCEGTVRKHPGILARASEGSRRYLADVQRALLLNALRICRPGGRVVYSTCTFAPEENESVVADVLERSGGSVRVVPVAVPGLRSRPGLTEWDGRRYPPAMALSHRLWPHEADTGGFFAVALQRTGRTASAPPAFERPSGDRHPEDPDVEPWIRLFPDRFGLDRDRIRSYRYRRSGRRYLLAIPADHEPRLPFEPFSTGLAVLRVNGRSAKPTTRSAIAFGHAAVRNRVLLDRAQALRFVSGRDAWPTPHGAAGITSSGWVFVAHGRITLGVGVAVPDPTGWRVESLYPKHFAGLSRPSDSIDSVS